MATQQVTLPSHIPQYPVTGRYSAVPTTNSSTIRERRFVPSPPPLNRLNFSDKGGRSRITRP